MIRVLKELRVTHQKDLRVHKVHHLLVLKVIRVLKVTEVVLAAPVIQHKVE